MGQAETFLQLARRTRARPRDDGRSPSGHHLADYLADYPAPGAPYRWRSGLARILPPEPLYWAHIWPQ